MFTISEVAVDWHKLMIPQHVMWPSVAEVGAVVQHAEIPLPQSATLGLLPIPHTRKATTHIQP